MPSPAFTAFADQIAAAANDAEDTLRRNPAPDETITTVTATAWLNEQYTALRAAVLTGTATACPHITDAPAVAHAAVWRRWTLACGPCSPLLAADPIEDRTCDRCRRYGIPLTGCTVAIGPILLAYGLCDTCMNHVHPRPTGRKHRKRR